MTEQQINTAIAEACGWSCKPMQSIAKPSGALATEVPNYCHDLNAMQEAEAMLFSRNDWSSCRFDEELGKLTHGSWQWHATARQRAEAFLRTIGKWRDE